MKREPIVHIDPDMIQAQEKYADIVPNTRIAPRATISSPSAAR